MTERALTRIMGHIERLNDADKDVSARAENLLIRHYRDRVFELILPSCAHPNPVVRLRAAWVIAHTGRAEAFDVLRQMVDDPDERVRYDVRVALGILSGTEALELLALQIGKGEDEEGASWYGLGKAGVAAFDPLMKLADHEDPIVRAGVVSFVGSCALEDAHVPSGTALRMFLNDPLERVRDEAQYWVRELDSRE